MERGVITEIPLHVWCTYSISSPSISSPVGVTSHTTPLSIRRGVGGEAGPIGVTSHITPLSIRRGAGGEATLSPYPHHDRLTFQGERAIEEDSVVSVDGNGIDAAILKGKEDRSAAVNEGFV